jgi:hypothetical protein
VFAGLTQKDAEGLTAPTTWAQSHEAALAYLAAHKEEWESVEDVR